MRIGIRDEEWGCRRYAEVHLNKICLVVPAIRSSPGSVCLYDRHYLLGETGSQLSLE